MSIAERKQPGRAPVSRFARSLLAEWTELGLAQPGVRAVVAVSGGADSTALLLALDELVRGGRLALEALVVAHLDHGLRGEAGADDARWVTALADGLKLEAVVGRASVGERAAAERDNLEQAARRARYEFLAEVAGKSAAGLVLTGHTMDDQAETVLLRLMRGSGGEGLGGMEPVRVLGDGAEVMLARPLLRWARRAETESYCRERGVLIRPDAMNEDERFARVRVRRHLLPLMESFNPRVVEALARGAELLRDEAKVLDAAAAALLEAACKEAKAEEAGGAAAAEASHLSARNRDASVVGPLDVNTLRDAPAALRRRALRLWLAGGRGDLRRLELVHLVGVEKLLEGVRGGRVAQLPGGSFVERRRGRLRFHLQCSPQKGSGSV